MPTIKPELGATIAKLLADMSGAFAAGNPVQERLSGILSDATGGLVRAQQFNRSNAELSQKLMGVINTSTPGVAATPANVNMGGGFVAPGVNGSSSGIGGVPSLGPPGTRTLGDVGLLEPSRIDPKAALAMGSQGTEDLIRQEQKERMRVETALQKEQDFSKQLQVIELGQKNRERLRDYELGLQQQEDIRRGGPEARESTQGLADVKLEGAQRQEKGAPTPEQMQAVNKANVAIKESQAAIAKFKGNPATLDLELAKIMQDAGLSPSEISSAQSTAIRHVAPGMLRRLKERMTPDEIEQAKRLFDVLGGDDLDEVARRTNFTAMVALLTPQELEVFGKQLGTAEMAVAQGSFPSSVVPLGSFDPTDATPQITTIDDVSLQDAMSEDQLLKRNLRRSGLGR